jgi:hypothetical protein
MARPAGIFDASSASACLPREGIVLVMNAALAMIEAAAPKDEIYFDACVMAGNKLSASSMFM